MAVPASAALKLVENMGLIVHQELLAGMFIWTDAGRDTEVLARHMAAQWMLLAPGGVVFCPSAGFDDVAAAGFVG